MAYETCEDCGTRIYNGICCNCQEELAILDRQSDMIDFPLSKEFLEKADEQSRLLEDRKNI